ncbi:unnamed protein product [Allacma fusca]|uniref:Uncharacterized protein n=1 Tax=Allacma fusca TaxID=39272 RepID=A0A8J2JJT5_9HEXA|nr:unnamed protein product [Allacma fusca]
MTLLTLSLILFGMILPALSRPREGNLEGDIKKETGPFDIESTIPEQNEEDICFAEMEDSTNQKCGPISRSHIGDCRHNTACAFADFALASAF